ncbi:MAG: hypothetical protein GSR85_10260 [Desulfurococcales archaeon]|nr:hypothetical protein [Desulfurococcales archaeon]
MPSIINSRERINTVELDVGWDKIVMHIINLNKPANPAIIADIDKQYRDCTAIGITKEISPCRIALALLYTQEDLSTKRARVRNQTILLLMNIYGFRQIKDLLDKIKMIDKIVMINCAPHIIDHITSMLKDLGYLDLNISIKDAEVVPLKCRSQDLFILTSNRLKMLSK